MKGVKCFFYLGLLSFFVSICVEGKAAEQADMSSLDLDSIVVTASRINQKQKYSTQNISLISAEDIESAGISEISEVLDLLPSVDVLEYGSLGSTRSVHSRGASSNQVLTLVDGRPVNVPRDGAADFNQISLSNIERVEILRGPAGSIYGSNAIGGVINVITKSGKEKMETQVLSKYGSFKTNLESISHGHKIKDFDYFVSYDYSGSKGHRDNSDYLSNNVNTKFGYDLNEDNHVSFASGYFNSEVGTPGKITNVDLDDRQEAFTKYFDMSYAGKLADGQNLNLKVFHNSDRLEFIETFNPLDKDTQQTYVYGTDAQVSQTFFDIFRTAIGADYQDHRLNSSTSDKHKYNLKGFYFETELDLLAKSSLKLGARWDDYSNFGGRISPSVSFHFWLFDKIKSHALAAQSFRAPTFNDLYWPREDWGIWGGVEGNPDLGPEKAVSYEAGFSGYFLNTFKTDITFFRSDINDLIEWTVDDASWWRPENLNSARINGAELETEFVVTEHLKANFNYTYLEAKDRETKKWLIYRPQHLYKCRLSYLPSPKYELGVSSIYKDQRYSNSSNTEFLKPYFVMNVHFAYNINAFSQILFEAKNIFDRAYEEEKDYSVPGRAFYGGIKLTF